MGPHRIPGKERPQLWPRAASEVDAGRQSCEESVPRGRGWDPALRRSLWAPLRSGDRCGVAAHWAAGAQRSALAERGPPAWHFHPRLLLIPDAAPARCVLAVSVVRTWKLRHSAIERLTPAHTAEEGETQTQAGGLQGPSCPRSDGWRPQQAPGLSQGDRAAPEWRGDGSGGTQATPEKPPRGQPGQCTGPSERAAPSPPGPRPPRPAVQRMGGGP